MKYPFCAPSFRDLARLCTLSLICFASSVGLGKPVVQKQDRLEIDWGSFKVRFYGLFQPNLSETSSFEDGQKKANSEGLLAAQNLMTLYYEKYLVQQGVTQSAARQDAQRSGQSISRSTYPYHVEYFQGGAVKVHFENSLLRLLRNEPIVFKNKPLPSAETSGFSGLVLRLNKTIAPKAQYRVKDEQGSVLFEAADMEPEAYQKNLMGRWLHNPVRDELTKIVGLQHVSLSVTSDASGDFIVKRSAWLEAVQDSLGVVYRGKIAIVIPEP